MEFKLFQLNSFAQENTVLRNRRISNHQNEKDKSNYKFEALFPVCFHGDSWLMTHIYYTIPDGRETFPETWDLLKHWFSTNGNLCLASLFDHSIQLRDNCKAKLAKSFENQTKYAQITSKYLLTPGKWLTNRGQPCP